MILREREHKIHLEVFLIPLNGFFRVVAPVGHMVDFFNLHGHLRWLELGSAPAESLVPQMNLGMDIKSGNGIVVTTTRIALSRCGTTTPRWKKASLGLGQALRGPHACSGQVMRQAGLDWHE